MLENTPMERHRKPIWRCLLLPGVAQSYTLVSPLLCCYLKMKKKKKSIVFPRHWLLPTHGFLWKWKYFPCFQGLSLTHSSLKSRLLGVMKEAMGGQSRQDRSRLLPFDLQFPVLFKILLARFLDFW